MAFNSDIKGGILIVIFIVYILYGIVKTTKKNFYPCLKKKEYLFPLIMGIIISLASMIFLVYFFFFRIEYATWALVSIFIGGGISGYGFCVGEKLSGNMRKYNEQIKNIKELSIYVIAIIIVLLWQSYKN